MAPTSLGIKAPVPVLPLTAPSGLTPSLPFYNPRCSHSSPTDLLAVPSTGRAQAGHGAFALTQANSITPFRFLLNY